MGVLTFVTTLTEKFLILRIMQHDTLMNVNLTFRGPGIVSLFLMIYFQQDATLHNLFISGKLLYMFRVVSPPIIRSTHNLFTVSGTCQTVTAICRDSGR